jgi:hypothetical protein
MPDVTAGSHAWRVLLVVLISVKRLLLAFHTEDIALCCREP